LQKLMSLILICILVLAVVYLLQEDFFGVKEGAEQIDPAAHPQSKTNEDIGVDEQGAVVDAIEDILTAKGNEQQNTSQLLQQKFSGSALDTVLDVQTNLYSVSVSTRQQMGEGRLLVKYLLDVVLKKDDDYPSFQWIQMEAYWDVGQQKLYDLELHSIDYLGRLNSPEAPNAVIELAEIILNNLHNPDPEFMGWRYQRTGTPGQQGIRGVNIIELKHLGSRVVGDAVEEAAVLAEYEVSVYEKQQINKSILYFKHYQDTATDKWQLEDIKLLDVRSEP